MGAGGDYFAFYNHLFGYGSYRVGMCCIGGLFAFAVIDHKQIVPNSIL
jgi:hypothetical protein